MPKPYIFPIAIPEEHLLVMVYVAARPVLGVMLNEISAAPPEPTLSRNGEPF